jgi:hypothetical protein
MWDEGKGQRFQQLRQQDLLGLLTEGEQAELASLRQELESVEAAYLAPATQRLRQQRESIEIQNSRLEALIRRKESLAQRLGDFLQDARAERDAIEGELAVVLGQGRRDSAKDR